MTKIEITMDTLNDDIDTDNGYNWKHVFADCDEPNVDKEVEVAPPGADVSAAPISRSDVAEIIAAVNGENDGDEWMGVFKLKDGRFLFASGGCDYTGWNCQASNSMLVCGSMEDMMQFGLSPAEAERLGLK